MTFKEQLFLRVASYAPWQRYVLTLTCCLGIAGAWFFVSYQPLVKKVTAQKIAQCSADQTRNEAETDQKKVTEKLRALTELFFQYPSLDSVIRYLSTIADSLHISLQSCTTSKTELHPAYIVTELRCVFMGDFFALLDLLEAIDNITNSACLSCELKSYDEKNITCTYLLRLYLSKS